jgi:hypothetical protein
MSDEPKKSESQYVALAGALGGCAVGIFFIAATFAGGQLWPATFAVIALAAMGFGIAFIMSKKS